MTATFVITHIPAVAEGTVVPPIFVVCRLSVIRLFAGNVVVRRRLFDACLCESRLLKRRVVTQAETRACERKPAHILIR
jgi:hypothetical protein